MPRHCRTCLAAASIVFILSAVAADDEFEIRPRKVVTDAEKYAAAVREFRAYFVKEYTPPADGSPRTGMGRSLVPEMQKLAAATQVESTEALRKHEFSNATANEDKVGLSKAEKEIVKLRFRENKPRKDKGNEYLTVYGMTRDGIDMVDYGPIRIVFQRPNLAQISGESSGGPVLTKGYLPMPVCGAGASVSNMIDSKGASFHCGAHISEDDTTTILQNETLLKLANNVLKLNTTHYFDLTGKRTVVFMYDAVTVDKIVVLK